jgi:hypothetical protein
LSQLFQGEGPLTLLLRDHLIQRLVTQVDNLDKPSVPPTALAARPLPGSLQVEPGEGGERIAASNAARYAPYVQAFTALDPAATATAYKRFYPLIQQAYVDLGRPEGYFNDRLVAVIDHLLDTPELAQSPLVQRDERGRYRFVDPTLQSRSIGQKALLRMDAPRRGRSSSSCGRSAARSPAEPVHRAELIGINAPTTPVRHAGRRLTGLGVQSQPPLKPGGATASFQHRRRGPP